MDTSANAKSPNRGFTLVELLVVITIIGILMGLTVAAVQRSSIKFRNAVIQSEISQLKMALEEHRNECGEYPPNFVDINIVDERGSTPLNNALQQDARDAVMRHLRRAFPRYVPIGDQATPANTPTPWDRFVFDVCNANSVVNDPGNSIYRNYYNESDPTQSLDPTYFDAASAVVFWIGGLPETFPVGSGQWIPAGFHSDPTFPFKRGGPRTKPPFDFVPERVVVSEQHHHLPWDDTSTAVSRFLRYYPERVAAPYVYFKSRRRAAHWQYGAEPFTTSSGSVIYVPYSYFHSIVGANVDNIAVAYQDPQSPPTWRQHDKFQLIAAGLDGQFGAVPPCVNGHDHEGAPGYRVTVRGANFSDGDYDNLASFGKGRLQDEME